MAAIAAAAGKAQLTARLATVARKKRKVNSDTCEIIYIYIRYHEVKRAKSEKSKLNVTGKTCKAKRIRK